MLVVYKNLYTLSRLLLLEQQLDNTFKDAGWAACMIQSTVGVVCFTCFDGYPALFLVSREHLHCRRRAATA